jgi:hypothetical protein
LADRKSFLLRIDRQVLEALRRWADDELRSVNGQIEFVLRRALAESGRTPNPTPTRRGESEQPGDERPSREK